MNRILRIIVGLVFLLSAFLKATESATFADLMGQYGFEWFGYAAPLLISVELILGLLLVFNIRPREVSAITVVFILSVSAIFLYGVLDLGITNCGCFGPLTWLNSHPWLTFTRNGVLIALLIPSLVKPQQSASLNVFNRTCITLIMVIGMFFCGYSFNEAKCLEKKSTFEPIPLEGTNLAALITCHPDSSYFVFAFSYGCPFCQNSIGNVNQFEHMGVADKVIGLAIKDSVGRERFNRLFEVNFEIREISGRQMYRIASTLPTTYLIRHDTIIKKRSGMVFSPALFIP